MTTETLPNNFDSCAKLILNKFGDKIELDKALYCSSCDIFKVALKCDKSRNCDKNECFQK